MAVVASCNWGDYDWTTHALDHVGSTQAPFTGIYDIALVTEHTACLTNSYQRQVHCVTREGNVVGVFGAEGEGPGEFTSGPAVTRGPDGTVATISEDRLALFKSDGRMVSEITLPIAFLELAAPVGETILAQHFAGGMHLTPVEIDVATGDLVWERQGLHEVVRTECERLALGVASPEGGWAFPACQRELVFLANRDDRSALVVTSPTHSLELPNDRDIAEAEWVNSQYQWYDVDSFKETPKRNHLRRGSLVYDDQRRLWVATERDRAKYSHFDVYRDGEHVGSVRIRDRILAYDIYGPTLTALVERPPDLDGIAHLATDWYDISSIDFER